MKIEIEVTALKGSAQLGRGRGECRTAERLSAEGRSKRRKLEPGVTAARLEQFTRCLARRQSSEPARDIRAHHASSSAVVVSRSARVVSSLARSGLAAS